MKALADCLLYTFVDAAYLRRRNPSDVARQLCDGGSDLIQLRAKNSSPEEIRAVAESMLPILRKAGVGLVINDHLELARELGADFCHLGQEDFLEAGRARVEELKRPAENIQIGLSTHLPEQAQRAVAAGADYIAVGPVFATATKPGVNPVTLEYVRWAAANVSLPWFAIGGITLENVDAVLAAGAKRICVVSAVLNAGDVAKACQEFRKRLVSAR